MMSELFIQAIDKAQAALAGRDRDRFVAAVRVAQAMAAQAMTGNELGVVPLLERCLSHYPSQRSRRILTGISRRETYTQAAQRHMAGTGKCDKEVPAR